MMIRMHRAKLIQTLGSRALGATFRHLSATPSPQPAKDYKDYAEIPAPPHYPLIGCLPYLIQQGGNRKVDKIAVKMRQDLGPIVRVEAPGLKSVFITEPDDFQKVFRAEGKNPSGSLEILEGIKHGFHKLGKQEHSLVFTYDENWRRLRMALQKHLLPPKEAESYFKNFWPTYDLASKEIPKAEKSLENFLPRLTFELTSNMLFDRNLHILDNPDPLDDQFVNTVLEIMQLQSALLEAIPVWRLFETPKLKKIVSHMEFALKRGEFHLNEAIKATMASPDPRSYVSRLMRNQDLTREELSTNVITLLIAGVDTTSNAMMWLLMHLASFPRAQEELHKELSSVLQGRNLDEGDVSRLPYLRNCLKESARMDPVSTSISRTLPADIELQGYRVPAGVMIVMSYIPLLRDPEVFEKPNEFIPERWEEGKKEARKASGNLRHDHPYMTLPFSTGPRMCIGARIANGTLAGIAARLVQDYVIELDPPNQTFDREQTPLSRVVPQPKFKFTPRGKR